MNIQELGFDPYNCSMEELKQKIDFYKNKAASENDFQMAVKLFINSVYGCLGSEYYNLYNPDIAEAVTLQGQDLIKYSTDKIDYYARNCWHVDEEAHKRIAEYMKSLYPEFDVDRFLNLAKQEIKFDNTLQVGGDSVIGSSMIKTIDGDYSIEELFNEYSNDRTTTEKLYVKSNRKIYNVNKNNELIISSIKYIIRHRVNKELWTLIVDGNSVTATTDHSFIVLRNNEKIVVKPYEITVDDKIITLCNNNIKICNIDKIYKENDNVYGKFVYDIEVDTENDAEHNFFANNILVHNTDSVTGNSIIKTERHKNGIKIEDFYNEYKDNIDTEIDDKHEAVLTDDKVLNWDNKLYYGDIKRIIRHKVSKKRWQLKTKSGKIVECTDDHSLIVFRNNKKIKIRPNEIKSGDKVLSIINN